MGLWRFAGLLLILTLAACESAPLPMAEAPPPVRGAGPPRGIDIPTDARDVSAELASSGLDFVARYYRDPQSRWPALTASEARALSAAGFKIVAVYEWHSGRPEYFSYQAGYYDAISAYRQALLAGQTAGSAIYFAVDFNARDPQIQGPIDQYFRGISSGLASVGGLSRYRIGVYGSGVVCAYLKQAHLVQYAWLSSASSWTGADYPNWNIRQLKPLPTLTFDHDANEARGDYGAFQIASQLSSSF
jgi:hypothetical protein